MPAENAYAARHITSVDGHTAGGQFGNAPLDIDTSGNVTSSGFVSAPATSGFKLGTDLFVWGIVALGSVFIGNGTGSALDVGGANTALGVNVLSHVTSGPANTGVGANALAALTTGGNNIAIGPNTLSSLLVNSQNIAIGSAALNVATSSENIGIGSVALTDLTSGNTNVAIGYNTGRGITTGSRNTILGANVTGLAAGLSDAIILADGAGNIQADYNKTITQEWRFLAPFSLGGVFAATNTVTNLLNLTSESSGTPAAGIGVGIVLKTETAAGNIESTTILKSVVTDVSAGIEKADFYVQNIYNGSPQDVLRVSAIGDVYIKNGQWLRFTNAADSGIDLGIGCEITRRTSDGSLRLTAQSGTTQFTDATATTTSLTGAVVITGGLGVVGNITTSGQLSVGATATPLASRTVSIYAPTQPDVTFKSAAGASGNKVGIILYDPASALSQPGFIIQNLDDSGGFVSNSMVLWRDGGATFGSTSYPGAAGMVLLEKSTNATYGLKIVNANTGASATAQLDLISGSAALFQIQATHNQATTYLAASAGQLFLVTNAAAAIGFGTNNTTRMTISGTGEVVIAGTTSNVIWGQSTASDTAFAAYYNNPRVVIQQLTNTVNNLAVYDFVTVNGNSAAAIACQFGSHTASAATGTLIFYTGNATSAGLARMFLDPTGLLALGSSASAGGGLAIYGTTYTQSRVALTRYGNSAGSADTNMQFAVSRGAMGVQTANAQGDFIAEFVFNASDGTNFKDAAEIVVLVDGAVATNSVPGMIRFATTPIGGTSGPLVRAMIDNAGNLGIGTPVSPDRRLHAEQDSSATATVTYLERLTSTSTGTPAPGIGAGTEYEIETAAGNNEVGATIEAVMQLGTSTAEIITLNAKQMAAGALQEAFGLSFFSKTITADVAYQNINTVQPWFPSGGAITVEAVTTYEFEGLLAVITTGASTTHTTGLSFTGTATLTSIAYNCAAHYQLANTTMTTATAALSNRTGVTQASNTTVSGLSGTTSAQQQYITVRGIIRINAAGTLIPNFTFSAAPGAGNVLANTFFKMRKLGSNTVVNQGNWA